MISCKTGVSVGTYGGTVRTAFLDGSASLDACGNEVKNNDPLLFGIAVNTESKLAALGVELLGITLSVNMDIAGLRAVADMFNGAIAELEGATDGR